MTRFRLFAILLLLALVSACLGPSREERFDPMIGQDIDVAFEAMGKPDEVIELPDNHRAYVWQRVHVFGQYEGPFRGHGRLNEPDDWFEEEEEEKQARVCSTSLVVNYEFIIQSWDYACKVVEIEQ